MDAIRIRLAMARSPDAAFAISRSASCSLQHGFFVFGATLSMTIMKEIQDV